MHSIHQSFTNKQPVWLTGALIVIAAFAVFVGHDSESEIPADYTNCSSPYYGEGPQGTNGTADLAAELQKAVDQVKPEAINFPSVLRTAEEYFGKSTLNGTEYVLVCSALEGPFIATSNGVNVGK